MATRSIFRFAPVEFAPGLCEIGRADAVARRVGGGGQVCFGGVAGDVQHRRARGGSERRAERLEVVGRRRFVFETRQERDVTRRGPGPRASPEAARKARRPPPPGGSTSMTPRGMRPDCV